MASVPLKDLQPAQLAQLACTYAALILHDEGIDIKGDKIAKIINAAGVKIQAFWPKLYAKALQGRNIADFFAVGGSSDSSVANTSESTKIEAAKQTKKEQPKKKEEPKKVQKAPAPVQEEFDGGMGGLFDF